MVWHHITVLTYILNSLFALFVLKSLTFLLFFFINISYFQASLKKSIEFNDDVDLDDEDSCSDFDDDEDPDKIEVPGELI